MSAGKLKKLSKNTRTAAAKARNLAYKNEHRDFKNKKNKLIRHLKQYPNDEQAKKSLGEM